MEVRNYVKKIGALAGGLTMVGATIFGAVAADLSMYPAPFLKDGEPNKLAIIVGDSALSSDVVGSVDIAQQLQKDAVKKVPVSTTQASKTVLKGDVKEIGTGSDILELNETIGNVNEILGTTDLAALAGGRITTDRGTTDYNQYLKFNASANFDSEKVVYDEDEYDNVGDFFFVNNGAELFDWKLEFEDGLESDKVGNDLDDLEDEDINIMGQTYTIVDTDIVGNSLTLQMLSGPIQDTLGEGESKTYELNGKEYKIEVSVISETANSGDGEVLFKINGKSIKKLSDGDTETLDDGTLVGIRDIVATGKDTQKSIVRFYLGAHKVELTDSDYTDDLYNAGGAEIDNENIEDGRVKIKASNQSSSRLSVSTIEYSLLVDALKGDLYVPPGKGAREFLDEPMGMLAPNWDITYAGLMDVKTYPVKLDSSGDNSYDLVFTNQEGINYKVPFLTNKNGIFKFGDKDDDLWFIEFGNGSNSNSLTSAPPETINLNGTSSCNATGAGNSGAFASYKIGEDDSFILSDQASLSDNTAFTHVMTWDNIDISNRKLTFSDESGGNKEIIYDGTTRRGDLVVGGHTYAVFVGTANATLWVDLNGDGSAGNIADGTIDNADKAFIATMGGLIIDPFANVNCSNPGTTAGNALVGLPRVNGTATPQVLVNFTTLAKEFDENGAGGVSGLNEVVTTVVSSRTNDEIGLSSPTGRPPYLTMNSLKDNDNIDRGMTLFGALVELNDPSGSDQAEEISIDYPQTQRGVQVFVTFGKTESSTVGGSTATQVVPIQIGAAKLASEVTDATMYNAVVVGGPCANTVSASLMGNPADCAAGFVEGEAWLKTFEHANGNVALLVAGYSALDTRRAARVLANYKDYAGALKGKEVKVKGTTLADIRIESVA